MMKNSDKILKTNAMHVRPVSYKNSALWKKSKELVNKISSEEPFKRKIMNNQLVHFKGIAMSLQQDIKMAYTQNDQQFMLYHFSKAKSSCLILEEMLSKIGDLFPSELYTELLRIIQELKTMLKNYIHLSHINILIQKRRKPN